MCVCVSVYDVCNGEKNPLFLRDRERHHQVLPLANVPVEVHVSWLLGDTVARFAPFFSSPVHRLCAHLPVLVVTYVHHELQAAARQSFLLFHADSTTNMCSWKLVISILHSCNALFRRLHRRLPAAPLLTTLFPVSPSFFALALPLVLQGLAQLIASCLARR